MKSPVDTGFETEAFADVVSRGEREDDGGHQRCVDQADAEEHGGEVSSEGSEGFGGLGDIGDFAVTGAVDRRGARDDDEEGDHIGDDAAQDDIDAAEVEVLAGDSLFDDRGLQVELHPWRNRRADQADNHRDVGRVAAELRDEGVVERGLPVGMGQERGNG